MENNKIKKEINDIVNDNLKALEQLFPSAVKDGQLDIKALKEELGDFEEVTTEKYELNWSGKQNAKKIVQQGIGNKTLKFVAKDSKNADTTENIYIEGDNLEVLKLLRQNYYNSIKMIYIDPPYNTGNDFVYNDTFKMDKEESDKAEGIISENSEKLQKNQKSTNRYHANWLNMMYPRLKLARDLLTDDGVIFISIDDNEQANLKRLCDEIFGEENFRNSILVRRRVKSLNIQFADKGLKSFNVGTENILVYSKSESFLFKMIEQIKEEVREGYWAGFWSGADRPTMRYEILGFTPSIGQWRWSKEKAEEAVKNYINWENNFSEMPFEIYAENNSNLKFIKRDINGKGQNGGVQYWINASNTQMRTSNWTDIEVSQIHKYFDIPFDNPKNIKLVQEIVKSSEKEKADIILDFFSGSATTAHAVMQLNSEDNGNRKYIMVQLPETIDEKSEAFKAGYKNISEIGKERIRRAGEKIKQEIEEYNSNLKLGEEPKKVPDIGFKVFKVDDTNIKWYDLENFNEESQYSFDDPDSLDFVLGSNDIDIVYEIMLRQNDVPLSESLEVLTDIGNRTYLYASTYLICLETEITEEMVEKLALLDPLPIKFVFRDSAFKDNISLKDETFRKLRSLIERNSGDSKVSYRVEFI